MRRRGKNKRFIEYIYLYIKTLQYKSKMKREKKQLETTTKKRQRMEKRVLQEWNGRGNRLIIDHQS